MVTPTTYTKIAATTVAGGAAIECTEGTNSRLTYTGTKSRHAFLRFNLTVDQTSTGVRTLNFAVFKNGSILANSEVQQVLTTADRVNLIVQGDDIASTNDYYELYTLIAGTGNVQVSTLHMNITAHI